MPSRVKRPYRSTLREANADATRLAIVQAASRLFVERGYVGTSIESIAEAAGVSRATVFTSVGGKPLLLKKAYDVALVGDDANVPLAERKRSLAIRAEPDVDRYLDRYAELVTEINGRLAAVYEAVRGAASADPEVREVFEKIQAERRIGAAHVVDDVLAKGRLRPGLEPEAAADLIWVLNDAGLYHMLVHRRGWTGARFRTWLSDTMRAQLLPPRISDPTVDPI
jgi:AcrR family transcriptional regulator